MKVGNENYQHEAGECYQKQIASLVKECGDPRCFFAEQKRIARTLPRDEVRRHARVSIDNRHRCQDCFCCACVEVLGE
jgi:hypothetical protein